MSFTYVQGMYRASSTSQGRRDGLIMWLRRDERPLRPVSVCHADPTRSLRLLLELHRDVLSAIRPADADRCAQRTEGGFRIYPTQARTEPHPQLLDQCLEILDPALFDHLREKNLSAELYAFPCTYPQVRVTRSCFA